jgi:hypothetical protein
VLRTHFDSAPSGRLREFEVAAVNGGLAAQVYEAQLAFEGFVNGRRGLEDLGLLACRPNWLNVQVELLGLPLDSVGFWGLNGRLGRSDGLTVESGLEGRCETVAESEQLGEVAVQELVQLGALHLPQMVLPFLGD